MSHATLNSQCAGACACPVRGPTVHTLEQPDQSAGKGSKSPLIKRARSKYFSKALASALYRHGGALKRQYGRSLGCSDFVEQAPDGTLTAHYCGYRWCLVCNRIRIARAISRYAPIVAEWSDAQFVTLTLPNVPAHALADTIGLMLEAFTSCKRALKRTHGLQFRAIRKLEVTYNPKRNDFHPHFHVILDGEIQARALVALWLDRVPSAVEAAQDVRPVTDGTLIEAFKYFTEVISKGTKRGVDAGSLAVIFEAMQGRRVWQSVGFTIPPEDLTDPEALTGLEATNVATSRLTERVVWRWVQEYSDWVDWETGDTLTGYSPGDTWRALVEDVTPSRAVDQLHERLMHERAGIVPCEAPASPVDER